MNEDAQYRVPTILVVDDEAENRYLIGTILRGKGYEVCEAESGEAALEWLDSHDCDLILLDLMMNGISGFDVCEHIRGTPRLARMPVIFLTARKDIASKVRGFDLGGTDYVTKPFDKDEILARVRAHLTIEDLRSRLISMERLAAVGQMVVTLNHEINNPLAAIAGNAELLEIMLKDAPAEVHKKLQVIQEQAMRIKNVLSQVRQLRQAAPKTYIMDTEMIDIQDQSGDEPEQQEQEASARESAL